MTIALHQFYDPSGASASTEDIDSEAEMTERIAARSEEDRIRQLNDTFRRTFDGGKIVLTQGFLGLAPAIQQRAIEAIKTCEVFAPEYDIYQEHELAVVEVDNWVIYAKIDYYDLDMGVPAEDPSDPSITSRVMTLMLSEEF